MGCHHHAVSQLTVPCPVAEVLAAGGAALRERNLVRAADGLAAPVLVGVDGRPGAGRTTVAQALRATGLTVAEAPAEAADVVVYVFVERLTPEDRAALSSVRGPFVAVLNKADLAGFGGAGPTASAAVRCRALERTVRVPVMPLAALPAKAVLDGTPLASGLAALARGCPVPEIGPQLLAELDLFGVAVAVAALRAGSHMAAVTQELRRVSGVDGVRAAIDYAAAEVRYRRATTALAALAGRAVGLRGGPIAEFLAGNEVAGARMAAAAAVVQAAGLPVEIGSTADEHLRAAVTWQRYAGGPVSELHRSCGIDIARGALRLWARA